MSKTRSKPTTLTQIADTCRHLGDLFEQLNREVTARKRYPGKGYMTAARALGVGVMHHGEVALTETERRMVREYQIEREVERKQEQEYLSWAVLT